MTTLGNALVTKILGHSEAEKAFRPWWDHLEDFLVYGLVMLVINSSPLDCNFCQRDYCAGKFDGNSKGKWSKNNPGFDPWWVKKYCTMTAVDEFILYFPYILLSMALVIVLIERVFIRIFKAGHKLESFYELVVKDILDDEDEDNEKNKEAEQSNAKTTVELTQSFSDGANFYYSYLLRTSLEILTALYLFQWLLFHGIPSLSKDQLIYCDVHGYQYECAGLPQQFYTYILLVVLVILVMYLACSFYNFLWLVHPHMGCLAKVMDDYKHGMNQEYLESLNALYYNNRDLKLLFDLLAQGSGVSLSIKILSLFDKQFRQKFQPNLLKFNKDCINNKCVLQVEEQESYKTMSSLINKGAVVYTIELLPPVSKCPVATLTFNKDKDVCKEVVFEDIDASITYKIRVTTNMNGKAVARKTYASTSTLEHEKEE